MADRLSVVTAEIANLSADLLAGVVSETLAKLLTDREAEKTHLEAQIEVQPRIKPESVPKLSELMRLFADKAEHLIETLNVENIRGEGAEILSRLIESVTTYPGGTAVPRERL